MGESRGSSVSELMDKCNRLEREQEEYEARVRKAISREEDHENEIIKRTKQLEHIEMEVGNDKEVIRILNEEREALNRIKKKSESLQGLLRREFRKMQDDHHSNISKLRMQMKELEN